MLMRTIVPVTVVAIGALLHASCWAAQNDIRITGVPATPLSAGDTFTAEFTIEMGEEVLSGFELDVLFNPEHLEVTQVRSGTTTNGDPDFPAAVMGTPQLFAATPLPAGDNGRIRVLGVNLESNALATGSVSFLRIDVSVVGESGEGEIATDGFKFRIVRDNTEIVPNGLTASYQIGSGETPCTVAVTGGSTSVPAGGGATASFNVDVTGTGCGWTVATTTSGVTFSPNAGDADGTFTATIPANNTGVARTIAVVVTPEGNTAGAVTRNITQEAVGDKGGMGCGLSETTGGGLAGFSDLVLLGLITLLLTTGCRSQRVV